MTHPNSPANDGQKPGAIRPGCVPRPSRPLAVTSVPKPSAAAHSRPISKVPTPPPSPVRAVTRPAKRSPPPLPEHVLLTDADLMDDADSTQPVRASQPTAVDVEIDCFSRTDPPPESRPRRKRAILAGITGLVLVVAIPSVLLLARPAATGALRLLERGSSDATPATAMLAAAALSRPTAPDAAPKSPVSHAEPAPIAAVPSVVPGPGPRPKLSAHSKRSKATVAGPRKPTKAARSAVLLNDSAAR
jgi:hypothetical protein